MNGITPPPQNLHPFGINASLSIDPNIKVDECVFDALCLMNAGMAALDTLTDQQEGGEHELMWAAIYLLRQAHAVIKVAAGVKPERSGAA